MANETLRRQFKSALVGYAQDNQGTITNKKNLILNSIKHPLRMAKLTGIVVNNRLQHKSSKEKITTFWSDEMTVVIPEEVSLKLFAYGYFEPGLTGIMLEYLNKNDTLIDIGAHFGYFTLLGSTIVGGQGKVHSFEPIPTTYEILKSNTINKSNIKINCLALFSNNSQMPMMDLGTDKSAYNSIVTDNSKNNSEALLNVNTICLDDYVNSNAIRPNFIKLDAEDAEYEVLMGAKKTLERFFPIISLEVGGNKSKKCITFLKDIGYSVFKCRKGKLTTHDFQQKYDYDNLLFLPH
jgi:FkbM family methyltransferase